MPTKPPDMTSVTPRGTTGTEWIPTASTLTPDACGVDYIALQREKHGTLHRSQMSSHLMVAGLGGSALDELSVRATHRVVMSSYVYYCLLITDHYTLDYNSMFQV